MLFNSAIFTFKYGTYLQISKRKQVLNFCINNNILISGDPGDTCTDNSDCTPEGEVCTGSQCVCAIGYIDITLFETLEICIGITQFKIFV